MSSPRVSIVIPVHNAGRFLAECLDSVLSQDFDDFELVAVDDGSTDDSLAILVHYRECDGRVRVVPGPRGGPAAARNRGLQAATGALIAFQDADDIWLPGKLRRQVEHLDSHPEHAIVFCQFAFWQADADGRFPDPLRCAADRGRWQIPQPLSGWIYAEELQESCIGMNTPLLRREVFERLGGFDEALLAGSDYDFWLRATFRFQAHKIPDCLALYRIHAKGVTGTPKRENYAALLYQRAVTRQGLAGPDGRTISAADVAHRLAGFWLGFGLQHLERGDFWCGMRGMARHVREAPSALRALRAAIPAGLGAAVRRWRRPTGGFSPASPTEGTPEHDAGWRQVADRSAAGRGPTG